MFGQANWEAAESELQRRTALCNMEKSGISREKIRYLFGGDLLGQIVATSFGVSELEIPLFGLYGACSTMGEALSLSAMTVGGGFADCVMAMASSHFCQRGEAVSVSAGLWKSEAVFFYLDSDGMRFCAGGEKGAQR